MKKVAAFTSQTWKQFVSNKKRDKRLPKLREMYEPDQLDVFVSKKRRGRLIDCGF
jgi:hypothetical protein